MNTRLGFLAASLVMLSAAPSLADGGYFGGNQGARAAGRGGAFTVKADDVMAVAYNPAGLSRLEGTTVQVGNRFSYNAFSYERQPTLDWSTAGGGAYVEFDRVENEKPWQMLDPLLGVTSNLGLDGWGFALVAYAPAGVSQLQFPLDGGQRYMMVSRKGEFINYAASAAWSYQDVFGLGATFEYIYLRTLEYELVIDGNIMSGLANPVAGNYDIRSKITASDPATFNAILGAWYKPAPFLEFGLSGQILPATWNAEGNLAVEPVDAAQDISLNRNGTPASDVTVELPLPLTARLGARYVQQGGAQELFDIELDIVYETWSSVDSFTVDSNDLSATYMGDTIPVGVIELQKQWKDTIGVHLGGDYTVVPGLLTARAGGYYETAVADDAYASVDFSSGQQVGATLGASLHVGPVEVALAYEYRRQLEQKVTEGEGKVYQVVPGSPCLAPYTDSNTCNEHYLGQPAPTVNGGSYRAYSHTLALDAMYRF